MWSLEMIDYLNQKAARKARRQDKEPTVTTPEEIENYPPFPFPHLGPYVPPGWERVEGQEWFVDSSGFGKDDEPALSVGQFKEVVRRYANDHPDHGFAIVEAGQFQLYVAAFRPVPVTATAA
jgi:hypothetical protein